MKSQKRPNVVVIFTDNQQASTLGCYGNDEIHTPHLDALAGNGVIFDNAFCPNGFCSPARASLMTGLMPSQHGVHSWIDDRRAAEWPEGWHALKGVQTLPMILKNAGYKTALIGKYHLGEVATPMDGFDHWVTLADGHIRSFYRNRMTENGLGYDHEGHTVDFFTDKAVDFIKAQTPDQPFFLYLPYPAPYGHWPATAEKDRCRHSARYDDCPMNTVPRRGLSAAAVDGFVRRQGMSGGGLDFSMLMRAPNDLATLRNYYAQISMVDEGVGQIIKTLDDAGMTDDTLVVFTADHGLSLGHHGFWGHGAATYPSNLHRAAHSVPLMIGHKGRIKGGLRTSAMVSNMDIFATILDHCDLAASKDGPEIASQTLVPILQGEPQPEDTVNFSEQEETRVIRTQKWAYFKRFTKDGVPDLGHALYDVKADKDEDNNLAGIAQYAEIERDLSARIDDYFAQFAEPKSDLWQGGHPIQNSVCMAHWRGAWGADWGPVLSYGAANE